MRVPVWGGILLAAGLGIGDVAAEPAADFSPVHRSEAFLLHRTIDARLLRGFQIWDNRLANWRAAVPTEIAGASASPNASTHATERPPLVLLHLWADWCAPCREEFPVLRRFVESLQRTYGDKVRLVLLSETSGPPEMRAFLEKYRAVLPPGPLYVDTGEGVAQLLRKDLPTTLPYPATLLLDGDRVVRHAVVGSIAARRAELLAAISRLLALPASPAKTPAP